MWSGAAPSLAANFVSQGAEGAMALCPFESLAKELVLKDRKASHGVSLVIMAIISTAKTANVLRFQAWS